MASGVQLYSTTGQGLPLVGETGALSELDDLLRMAVMGPDPIDTVVRAGAVTISDFKDYILSEAQTILDDTQAIYDAFDSTFLGVYANDTAAEVAAGGTPDEGAQYFNSTATETRIYVSGTWYPMSYNSTNVSITGGTIEDVEITNLVGPIGISDGGTGGRSRLEAVTALGLGTVPIHCTADETNPDAIVLTTGFGLTTIPVGFEVTWIATATNTGAMTIKVDNATAASARTPTRWNLRAGYIRVYDALTSAVRMRAWWDGTVWTVHRGTQIIKSGDDLAIRYEDGSQTCTIDAIEMTMNSAYSANATVTFPSAFYDDHYAPVVTVRPPNNTDPIGSADGLCDTSRQYFGATIIGDKLTTQFKAAIMVNDAGLISGDKIYGTALITGRWHP